MQNKLDTIKRVVLLKSGLRYYISEEDGILLEKVLSDGRNSFCTLQGDLIANNQIEGIFTPDKVEEADKRRRGMWMCRYNRWHNKYDNCECGRQH